MVVDEEDEAIGLRFEAWGEVRIQTPGTGEINVHCHVRIKVELVDNGEPGHGADYFRIKFDQEEYIPEYLADGLLVSGNIQLHT